MSAKFAFEMTPSKEKDKKIRVVRVEFLDDNPSWYTFCLFFDVDHTLHVRIKSAVIF